MLGDKSFLRQKIFWLTSSHIFPHSSSRSHNLMKTNWKESTSPVGMAERPRAGHSAVILLFLVFRSYSWSWWWGWSLVMRRRRGRRIVLEDDFCPKLNLTILLLQPYSQPSVELAIIILTFWQQGFNIWQLKFNLLPPGSNCLIT